MTTEKTRPLPIYEQPAGVQKVTRTSKIAAWMGRLMGGFGGSFQRPESKIILKHSVHVTTGGTIAQRLGKEYRGGGLQNFYDLQRMFVADPRHVARPLELHYGDDGHVDGYTSEQVEGRDLYQYREKFGKVPDTVFSQVREAVERFHAQGVVHGDLNGRNILVANDGTVKIIDPVGFGSIPAEDFAAFVALDFNPEFSVLGDPGRLQGHISVPGIGAGRNN